ncbi:efflux RND transporter periplasmic adaptor subunit [Snuella sedimenti]|uniref:Efflux RND transporter periplasmic adaptor subunit n=1 Tax=Snuella sedimenti TaxID=2798802 RepID=A0A8J7LRJ6_9FLAO|nr:efflux RND transporter periplasmic adaptor subunit [Snuella sedimenti]MBJ6366546.1 efflux RND transporter periplasmic adaptor subunit [Snuella sedimenti]
MRKYIIYIGILTIGILLGWFFFGGSSNRTEEHDHGSEVETKTMWTCSMHPQILQPEPGDCPICGMDLIPAEAGADGLSKDQFKLTENAMALANVQTSVIEKADVDASIVRLSGKITENKDKAATQPVHFSGRIDKLYVKSLGEYVKRGQAIAEIYSAELIAAQQELLIAYKNKASQPELYEAVKKKFRNWMIQDAQVSEIERSGNIQTQFTIYSNISGVVTEIALSEGAHIMEGNPLFKIANLNTVWANFDVYESQIDLFKLGQEIEVVTNAYPDKTFKATVDFIDPLLNTNTRTVTLRAVLNNKEGIFKPGMFVEGQVNALQDDGLLLVPSSAVLWTGKRSVVYIKVKTDTPVFEMREVTLGKKMGAAYEVLDGLERGDEIVTNGTFTIDAAAQLQGKKSMMNKSGGKVMTGHEGHMGMDTANPTEISRFEVATDFHKQLQQVFDGYIQIKDALVKDNAKEAQEAAKQVGNRLNKVDMTLLTDSKAHAHWMVLEKGLQTTSAGIAETLEIQEQRKHFRDLSLHLIDAIQRFGIDKKVYEQFCPMADNNKGAYWLSNEETILNPYFGDAMLNCGEVKLIIE